MKLRTVYFESAAGRGVFIWHEGKILEPEAAAKRAAVTKEFADIIAHPSKDSEKPYGRLVISGTRMLAEFHMPEENSGRGRAVRPLVVVDDLSDDAAQANRISAQVQQILSDESLHLDPGDVKAALEDATRRRFRPPSRKPRASSPLQAPGGGLSRVALAAAPVIGLLILIWIVRRLTR